MVIAYVLIKANTGEADRLLDEITGIDDVLDAHVVAGDVDLIGKIQVESPQDVKDIVANEVQSIDGVEDTETYISMD
ncbi:MAG: Lrp/AsnC family transcriptional regulator [Halodesulfurarchaeum sp.]